MYALFDETNKRAIAVHEKYLALAALSYIQFANVDTLILNLSENKGFSNFTQTALGVIYNALPSRSMLPEFAPATYRDALRQTREAVINDQILRLPFTSEELEAQARSIDKEDDRPYVISSPGGPTRVGGWTVPPNRNRPRSSSSFWVQFASANSGLASTDGQFNSCPWLSESNGAMVHERTNPQFPVNEENPMAAKKQPSKKAPGKAPAKKSPAANTPAAPKEKKARAPRADRIEQNGVVRPRPGGLCAQVWDIADSISKAKKRAATSAEVMEQGKAAGLNESNIRCEFQRWRKFNGITGRQPKAA